MSGTTIGQYNKVGLQNLEGEIRFKQDSQELTNKGSLGQTIATFFNSIGEAISGLFGKSKDEVALQDDRAQRQSEALKGFSKALEEKYGGNIRDWALEAGKLDGKSGEPIKFTGLSIKQALDEANTYLERRLGRLNEMALNWQSHVTIPSSLIEERTELVEKQVPDYEKNGYGDHNEYTKTIYEYETFRSVPKDVDTQMRRQVEERLRTESDSGKVYLNDERVKQIIAEELERIPS